MDTFIEIIKLVSALLLAIYTRYLIQSFSFMGLSELRRRAVAGNEQATRVLAARVHGLKLWLIMWFVFCLMIFIIITTLNEMMSSFWLAALVGGGVIVALVFVMPLTNWINPRLYFAAQISPGLTWVMDRLLIISAIFRPLGLSRKISLESTPHIHSKEHLIEILEKLKAQAKSGRTLADLDLAVLTLSLSSKKVKTLMIPISKIKKVRATQDLTPKTIDKLHSSGFSVFPVRRSESGDFIGLLHFKDIEGLKMTRAVHQLMKKEICYIHAEAPLNYVLDAFLKTEQQLFLVVDRTKKIRGLIDLKDVLRSYIGEYQVSDFKHYDDLELVAKQPEFKEKKKKNKRKLRQEAV